MSSRYDGNRGTLDWADGGSAIITRELHGRDVSGGEDTEVVSDTPIHILCRDKRLPVMISIASSHSEQLRFIVQGHPPFFSDVEIHVPTTVG
jgi:hypothetical protein